MSKIASIDTQAVLDRAFERLKLAVENPGSTLTPGTKVPVKHSAPLITAFFGMFTFAVVLLTFTRC